MSRSEPTRNPEAGGETEMREEQWQALFAAADPASEASEALLRRLATLAAERDARAAASGRSARILDFWRLRPPHVRPIALTVAAGLLLAAFALSIARRDRGSVRRDERSVTAPQADAHRVVRAPRSVPRPSMPFAERPAGAWRPAGPGARVPAMPDPSVRDANRTGSNAPRLQDAAP
jgi:hypothetical protein